MPLWGFGCQDLSAWNERGILDFCTISHGFREIRPGVFDLRGWPKAQLQSP